MTNQIILTSPPSRSINHFRPPLALLYIGGFLKQKDLKVKIVDITLNQTVRNSQFYASISQQLKNIYQQTIQQILNEKPQIVGITCYTPEYFEVLKLARTIKKKLPNTTIVVGGIHPTLFPDELLTEKNSPVDYEVIGEGEETMYELSLAILKKTDPTKTKGIAYLDRKTHRIIITPNRPVSDNLDSISYPDYSLINMSYYTTASPYAIRGCFLKSMYLLATRGCPSQCTFCVAKSLRQFNGGGRYTRIRSAKNIIDELKTLKHRYHIDSFYFIDDLFSINKENVLKFCNLLKSEKLNLLWGCSSKVSTLNETVIKAMAESGCIQIDFGVERGSDESLNMLKKGINIKMITEIFNLCHQYHIRTFANFLVNLPGETKADLNDIISLTQKLKPEVTSFNCFIPYPGTEIYDQAKYHFKKNEYPLLVDTSKLITKEPNKYRFAKHNIDIIAWAIKNNQKYNSLVNNFLFHLSPRYLITIIKSGNIPDYLHQSKNLLREIILQKFGI